MRSTGPLEICFTARDGEQSSRGTNTSAHEISQAYRHVHSYGIDQVQTAGGTFFDLPARLGRDPFRFNEDVCGHFEGITQRALIRGEFGMSPNKRQSFDALYAQLKFLATCGVNQFQNFNACNDVAFMRGVAIVANRLADEGHDVYAQGMICVQEDEITKANEQKILDGYFSCAEKLIYSGHKDLVFKNANGVLVSPEFVQKMVEGVNSRFNQKTYFHTHNTYGLAYQTLLAATEAGITGVDLLPEALADGTAQAGISTFIHTLQHSGSSFAKSRIPTHVDLDVVNKDFYAQMQMRGLYATGELAYDRELLGELQKAGSAGGAITSLKKTMPDAWKKVGESIGSQQDRDILMAIAAVKASNRAKFGYVTNVTPTENTQDVQALGGDMLQPMTIKALNGGFGQMPEGVDPDWRAQASNWPKEEYLPIERLGNDLPESKKKIRKATGSNHAGNKEALIVSILGDDNGLTYVKGKRDGSLVEPEDRLPNVMYQDDEVLDGVYARISSIAYAALEITRFEDGHMKGVKNVDTLIADRKARISIDTEWIEQKLSNEGCYKFVAKLVGQEISDMAKSLGANTAYLPEIDSSMLSVPERKQGAFKNKRTFQEGISGQVNAAVAHPHRGQWSPKVVDNTGHLVEPTHHDTYDEGGDEQQDEPHQG